MALQSVTLAGLSLRPYTGFIMGSDDNLESIPRVYLPSNLVDDIGERYHGEITEDFRRTISDSPDPVDGTDEEIIQFMDKVARVVTKWQLSYSVTKFNPELASHFNKVPETEI